MLTASISFHVIGDPKQKGSAKAFVRGGRAVVTNDCATEKPWAQAVHWAAREAMTDGPWLGPVSVTVRFSMPRPGRLGKKRTDVLHDKKPDIDKCLRSVLDALTGVCFVDDAQVAFVSAEQLYADHGQPSGARIGVARIGDPS